MTEDQSQSSLFPGSTLPPDLSGSTIRGQLIWASLFPLVFFGLLTTLVISSALYQMTFSLASQRNMAQVQVIAHLLMSETSPNSVPTSMTLNSILKAAKPENDSLLYLIDPQANLLASTDVSQHDISLNIAGLLRLTQNWEPASQLMDSTITFDKEMVSFAPLPGEQIGVILVEPWDEILSPTFYYQLVSAGLLVLGIVLSLGMLSLSIGRIIRPIGLLVKNATGAVPGSVFHPVPEYGPQEIRALIYEFNQMVIRLAEQQSAVRQYAHKALLSQEEERQRLSHELHDGTLQDLIALVQRVELCRNELESNPMLARRRLVELHGLLEQTLEGVRRISIALRPPVLEDFGLSIALDALCKDLQQEIPSLQCDYVVTGKAHRLQPDLELAIYRVVQEALTNIRKHVKDANLVQVDLAFGETEIQATIKNNGALFSNQDVRSFVRSGHLGLAGMYERAHLFGGALDISTDADQNTVVSIRLPYTQDLSLSE